MIEITSPTTHARECFALKEMFKMCKRMGWHATALKCYIRLHEIEDGY